MDRDRLKQIQTADISESNVNEDFVQWMKTKGPSYLLIIMLVIAGYLFLVRYQQGQAAHRSEAWIAYLEARVSGLPASHEDVSQSYAEIDSIRELGLLSAADAYLQAVVTGQIIGSTVTISTSLTDEDRTFYLEKADSLYSRIVSDDDQSEASSLLVVSGLSGRAAVAEARGDIDLAKTYYEAVIARINTQYPALASQAQRRIDTLAPLAVAIILPTDAEVTARNNQVLQRDPTPMNTVVDALTDLTDTNGN